MRATLEGSNPSVAEVDPRVQRFHPHGQRLNLKADAGDVGDNALDDLVVKRIPLRLASVPFGLTFGGFDIQLRLQMKRPDQWIGIEEQFEERIEQAPNQSKDGARRVVDGRVVERIDRLA
jgi:hypothetical protein